MSNMLAIIPARKGSKRLPNKNMMLLHGYPLIYYTLIQAKFCDKIKRIVVTTDSKEVKRYVSTVGFADQIYDRPDELATDDAKIEDEVYRILRTEGQADRVMLLQPTSPLRNIIDMTECYWLSAYGNVTSISKFCDIPMYRNNGAVYVWDAKRIIDRDFSYDVCYVMPPERSVDIDTEADFKRAEELMLDRNRIR